MSSKKRNGEEINKRRVERETIGTFGQQVHNASAEMSEMTRRRETHTREKGEKEENTVIDTHTKMPMPSLTSEEGAHIHPSP